MMTHPSSYSISSSTSHLSIHHPSLALSLPHTHTHCSSSVCLSNCQIRKTRINITSCLGLKWICFAPFRNEYNGILPRNHIPHTYLSPFSSSIKTHIPIEHTRGKERANKPLCVSWIEKKRHWQEIRRAPSVTWPAADICSGFCCNIIIEHNHLPTHSHHSLNTHTPTPIPIHSHNQYMDIAHFQLSVNISRVTVWRRYDRMLQTISPHEEEESEEEKPQKIWMTTRGKSNNQRIWSSDYNNNNNNNRRICETIPKTRKTVRKQQHHQQRAITTTEQQHLELINYQHQQ